MGYGLYLFLYGISALSSEERIYELCQTLQPTFVGRMGQLTPLVQKFDDGFFRKIFTKPCHDLYESILGS